MPVSKSLPKLIESFFSLIESEENQKRLALQKALNDKEKVFAFNSWKWSAGLSVGDSNSPVPGVSIKDIALNLGEVDVDFARMITEKQLQDQILFFEQADSDTPIAAQVFTNMGLSWLYSPHPIGEVCVVKSENGAFVHTPVLKDSCAQWTLLPKPVFQVDQKLHQRRMEVYSEITGGEITLLDDLIPLPIGSVFGTASRLRGDAEVLMDFRLCPDDVHALMRFLTDSVREYNLAREHFLKKDIWSQSSSDSDNYLMYVFAPCACIGGVDMYNAGEDHVSTDMFSEDDYLEFIFPYQNELLKSSQNWYVHSCGNLTPLYKHIAKLPNVHRVHVSPWSKLEAAVEALGNSVILEIHQPINFDELSKDKIDYMADQLVDLCWGNCTVDIVLPYGNASSENSHHYKNRILQRTGLC
jgi:hypothetical protein